MQIFAVVVRIALHAARNAPEPADAVLDMHHIIAGRKLGQKGVARRRNRASARAPLLRHPEYLSIAEHRKPPPVKRQHKPFTQSARRRLHQRYAARRRQIRKRICQRGVKSGVCDNLR